MHLIEAPQPLLKGGPPRDPLELQRREKLWIEQAKRVILSS